MAFAAGRLFTIEGVINVLTDRAEAQLKNFEQQGRNTATGLSGSFNRIANSAAALAGRAAIGAIGAAFVAAADQARELINAMARFRSETGASADEAQRFADQIQRLRRVNTDSTEALARTLTQVRREFAGLGDQTEAVTQAVLDYAKVVGGDGVEKTRNLANLLRAWGIEAKHTEQLTDVLTKTFQQTGVSLDGLEQSLSNNAQTFRALGLSIEDSVAVLGTLVKAGVGVETANESLRRLVVASTKATDEQKEAMRAFGIELDQLGRPVGGAQEVFHRLVKTFGEGQLSADQIRHAITLLGEEAGTKFVRAFEGGEEALKAFSDSLIDSKQVTQAAGDAFDQQFGERLTLIYRDKIEPVVQVIANAFKWLAEKALEYLGKLFDYWAALPERFARVSESWTGAIQGMKEIFGAFADYILDRFKFAIDGILKLIQVLPGRIRESLKGVEAELARTSQQLGSRERFGGSLLAGADKLGRGLLQGTVATAREFNPVSGFRRAVEYVSAGTEDVVNPGGSSRPRQPLGTPGLPPAAAATPADDIELRLQALQRLTALEKISTGETVRRYESILAQARAAGLSEEKLFEIGKALHDARQRHNAEQKKASDERRKDLDQEARAAEKLRKEAERSAEEAKRRAEQRAQIERGLAVEIARIRQGEEAARELALQHQAEDLRRQGLGEVEVAEYVAAKRLEAEQAANAKLLAERERLASATEALERQTLGLQGNDVELRLREIDQQVQEARKAGVAEDRIREFVLAAQKDLVGKMLGDQKAITAEVKQQTSETRKGSGFDFTTGGVLSLDQLNDSINQGSVDRPFATTGEPTRATTGPTVEQARSRFSGLLAGGQKSASQAAFGAALARSLSRALAPPASLLAATSGPDPTRVAAATEAAQAAGLGQLNVQVTLVDQDGNQQVQSGVVPIGAQTGLQTALASMNFKTRPNRL